VKHALVLGGGGLVGIAWEVGLLVGLANAGIDLTGQRVEGDNKPDVILGTSAGSMVGALLTQNTLAQLSELAINGNIDVVNETLPHLDFAVMATCFEMWQRVGSDGQGKLAVCEIANSAPTIDEARYVESVGQTIAAEWSDPRFYCVSVNTTTGEHKVWGAADNVSQSLAVASSCAVPSIFPTVTITTTNPSGSAGNMASNDRYTDGGVHSGTSIDWVSGYDRILVFAPIGSWAGDTLDASATKAIITETATVEAAGSSVITVFTDDETNQATLGTPLGRMDPSMRTVAFENGLRQAAELAKQLTGWW
jgi:NTE family protein